jgi:purine-binding chemotaxis protein CheW
VIDPAILFGKPATRTTKRTCIIIVEIPVAGRGRQDVGLIVDAVNAVLDMAAADIEPPPPFGTKIGASFIQGMGKVDGKFVIVLDVDRLVSSEAMGSLVEAASSPSPPAPPGSVQS